MKARLNDLSTVNLDIHIDIAVIGFPSSTVQFIRDYWFDNLGRTEKLMFTLGDNDEIIVTYPHNDITLTYHFHMIQVSFLVGDSLRDRMRVFTNISRPLTIGKDSEPIHIMHTWEMEETLASLSDVISATHNRQSQGSSMESNNQSATSKPSATIFVVNIPSQTNYTYCSSFTSREILELRSDSVAIARAKAALSELIRPTRVDLSLGRFAKSLGQQTTAIIDSLRENSSDFQRDIKEFPKQGLHYREAIKETRDWARSFSIETAKMTKVSSTACRIAIDMMPIVTF